MSRNRFWSNEELDYLRYILTQFPRPIAIEKHCERYPNRTKSSVSHKIIDKGWLSTFKTKLVMPNSWSEEEIEYLKECNIGNSMTPCINKFRERFPNRSCSSVKSMYTKVLHLKSDKKAKHEYMSERSIGKKLKQPRKGTVPIGGVVVFKKKIYNGEYIENKYIKIKHGYGGECYMPYAKFVWEKANGKAPEGAVFMLKDGDHLNCELNNIIMMPDRRTARYMQDYLGKTKEIAEIGEKMAHLKSAIKGIEEDKRK